jgi:hypothetical protein
MIVIKTQLSHMMPFWFKFRRTLFSGLKMKPTTTTTKNLNHQPTLAHIDHHHDGPAHQLRRTKSYFVIPSKIISCACHDDNTTNSQTPVTASSGVKSGVPCDDSPEDIEEGDIGERTIIINDD